MRVLLALALLWIAAPAFAQTDVKADAEKMRKHLEAQRDHARKTNAPADWLAVAEATRMPPLDIEMLPPGLRVQIEHGYEKSLYLAMFREAASHLDPLALAALSANLRDPEVNAAMIKALRAAKREDEAAAECRATFAWRTPADVPRVLEACKDCRTVAWSAAPGPASHSVFAQWFAAGGESSPYHRGLAHGLTNVQWLARVRIHGFRPEPWIATREVIGLVIGDPANDAQRAIAETAGIPFLSFGSVSAEGRNVGFRPFVAAPGPRARAGALLAAAHRQGVKKLALVVPDSGGDATLAAALERMAKDVAVVRVTYTAGRRDHRDDAARVRATGADAIALLGPGEESADWLPSLKGGAIFVRSRYTPVDTLAWTDASAAGWIAGWAVGDAMAHGADSPGRLAKALDGRATESDASNRWLAVPAELARVEVVRVRDGRTEPLP